MNQYPLIDIQHLTYTYSAHNTRIGKVASIPALQDVNLQVQQGEYLVLLGHNGSGKSTLARHCNALLTPESGYVLVAGLITSEQANQRKIRDLIGMIFQNPDNQIIATVVEDDVAWALTVRGLPIPLITDEATAQLDPLSRAEIVSLLHQLNQQYGLTIIQVTHLLEEAVLAQRIIVMEQGKLVMEGTPASIFANLERLRQLKLAIPEPIELAALLRASGKPISPGALTVEAIAQEIMQ